MTIGHLLAQAQKQHLEQNWRFLCHLLGKDKTDLLAHPEVEVPVEHLATLQTAWTRLLKGEPVAYLTQTKEFMVCLYIDARVLVPRDATERLVDYVLEGLLPECSFEIGTGSGAISVALLKTRPDLDVTASDVSPEALEGCEQNCVQNGVEVKAGGGGSFAGCPCGRLRSLVANLPYIGEEKNRFIAENVEAPEPHVALFGGFDGLQLYVRLLNRFFGAKSDLLSGLWGNRFHSRAGGLELAAKFFPEYEAVLLQDYEGFDRHFILTRP